MSRSIKKGPFVQPKLLKENSGNERQGRKESFENMVKKFYNLPRFRRTHDSGSRRQKARSRLHNRGYGRLKTGRVCAYENV